MRRRKAGAGSMATTSCPSSFKASGSPTGSKLLPIPHPRNPKPPPPEPSGHHQNPTLAPDPVAPQSEGKAPEPSSHGAAHRFEQVRNTATTRWAERASPEV